MNIPGLRRWKASDGSSLVEFGLVAILLVIVLLGVVEMGRVVVVYTTLADAARAGARYAIVHGSDQTSSSAGPSTCTCQPTSGTPCSCSVGLVAQNFASAGLITINSNKNLKIMVSYPNGTNTPGSTVQVQVSYTYDPLVHYFSSVFTPTMVSTSEGVIVY